jgi:hypothetical protein
LIWRVPPRPWHYGYSDPDGEQLAGALRDLRVQAGYETHDAMAEAVLDRFTKPGASSYADALTLANPDVIAALEFPFVDFHDYLEALAEFYEVSPGTLLDEIYLLASNRDIAGHELPEEIRA